MYVRWFSEIGKDDVLVAGGKGASLGEMTRAGIPVPPGFVVTVDAFRAGATPEVVEEIGRAFATLGADRVAVRSSAAGEDSKEASWAGQLGSYLNTTRDTLIENVKRCWASVASERAKAYQAEKGQGDAAVAVVVQQMVRADAAGVCFTVHPVTARADHMIIEACRGLGDRLVGGEVTPDGYTYDKTADAIIDVFQADDQRVLTDDEVRAIAAMCGRIESHFGFPCDIEWAIAGGDLSILQSRPITTL